MQYAIKDGVIYVLEVNPRADDVVVPNAQGSIVPGGRTRYLAKDPLQRSLSLEARNLE